MPNLATNATSGGGGGGGGVAALTPIGWVTVQLATGDVGIVHQVGSVFTGITQDAGGIYFLAVDPAAGLTDNDLIHLEATAWNDGSGPGNGGREIAILPDLPSNIVGLYVWDGPTFENNLYRVGLTVYYDFDGAP